MVLLFIFPLSFQKFIWGHSTLCKLCFGLTKEKNHFFSESLGVFRVSEVEYQRSLEVVRSLKKTTLPLLLSQRVAEENKETRHPPPPNVCYCRVCRDRVCLLSCFCPVWSPALSQLTQGCVRMLPPRTFPKFCMHPTDTLRLKQEAVLLMSTQHLIFVFIWQGKKFFKI